MVLCDVVDRRDTLNLDGQGDTDTYAVFTGGSLGGNTGGQPRDYIISVLDSGALGDGEDTLAIDGSAGNDVFLLRQLSQLKAGQEDLVNATEYYKVHGCTPPVGTLSMGYVALLHGEDGTAAGEIRETNGFTGYVTNGASNAVERINYTENINARLIVRGLGGDDVFAVDDNAAITTLDGGAGKDSFQIGQMYGAPRVRSRPSDRYWRCPTGAEDIFATIRTTRGDLSRGVTFSLVAMGDTGDDIFTVYSNKAEIRLEGNDDNDTFIVRAFALADQDYTGRLSMAGVSTENTTLVQPGDGDDLVQYNINAPVDVDGGRGFDRLVVLGTEFGDNFVITDDGDLGRRAQGDLREYRGGRGRRPGRQRPVLRAVDGAAGHHDRHRRSRQRHHRYRRRRDRPDPGARARRARFDDQPYRDLAARRRLRRAQCAGCAR